MNTTLPLFPLHTVLLPDGRLLLQVFERRYLDLVRDSLRESQPFGIVWIRDGDEVQREAGRDPVLARVGVEARIVDWDTTDGGLLAIVVEGGERFNIEDSWCESSGLWVAEVEYWQSEPRLPLPPERNEWLSLLEQLGEHPRVRRLGMSMDVDDAATLGHRLAQLLPVTEAQRYELLTAVDPVSRLDLLHDLIVDLGQ